VDRLIDELAGGAGRLDRAADPPTATLADADAMIVLHEDGPTFQFVIEQVPAFVSAAAALFSAWTAWRPKQPTPVQDRPRDVHLQIGGNTYSGPVKDIEEIKSIAAELRRP
jgi:hypothetical protein